MTPFSLEQARAGKAVIDRIDRNLVHFVGCKRDGIIAIERISDGYLYTSVASDLAMAPETHTMFALINPAKDRLYHSEELAKMERDDRDYLVVAKVTWEA